MALPTLSTGREPRQTVGPLVDTLLGMLGLAFVLVRLNDTERGQPIEIARIADVLEETVRVRGISAAIDATLTRSCSVSAGRTASIAGFSTAAFLFAIQAATSLAGASY
jgi:hypothetical protein